MRRLGLAVLGTLLGLLLGEAILEFTPGVWKNAVSFGAPYGWLDYDPVLAWRNRPGFESADFRVNERSLRGPDISLRKAPGTLRIVCVGDSRTFGFWLDRKHARYDSDYASFLERLIRAQGSIERAEVINAGVIGYTSAHGLRQFRTELLELEPDIAVVSFGFNDHSMAWNAALRSLEPRGAMARRLLYTFADVQLFQLGLRLYQGIESRHPAPFSVRWVEPDDYAYHLRRFAELAAEYDVHLLFLAQALRPIELGPSLPAYEGTPETAEDYALFGAKDLAGLHRIDGQYRSIMVRVAREAKVPVADAATVFAAHRREPLFSRYDAVHVNPRGARVIAQTIFSKLEELGWLPSR